MIGLTSTGLAVTLDSLSPSSHYLIFIPVAVAAEISSWVELIILLPILKSVKVGAMVALPQRPHQPLSKLSLGAGVVSPKDVLECVLPIVAYLSAHFMSC